MMYYKKSDYKYAKWYIKATMEFEGLKRNGIQSVDRAIFIWEARGSW